MINPVRLQQARELRGWTQIALAWQVGVHPSAIAQLEAGRMQPSPEVLVAISQPTGFPPAFFTRPSRPSLPLGSLRFRARAAMTARQRRQSWWYAQTLYELMAQLAAQAELPAPRLPRLDSDPVAAARLTREALGLPPDRPIGPLIRILERAGVWVLAIPVPLPRWDACSAWAGGDGTTPVLVVAATPAGDRRRFSVAHELGHLVLHQVPQGPPCAGTAGGRVCRSLPPARSRHAADAGAPDHPHHFGGPQGPLGRVVPGPDPAGADLGGHLPQSRPGALCPTGGTGLADPGAGRGAGGAAAGALATGGAPLRRPDCVSVTGRRDGPGLGVRPGAPGQPTPREPDGLHGALR